jgi:hypothetical protein
MAKNFYERLLRWKFLILNFKSYKDRLNRCVDVECELALVAAGKKPALSKDDCRRLAAKLGVPDCFQNKASKPPVKKAKKRLALLFTID